MLDGYLREGDGFIVVYSIANLKTFQQLSRFMVALERSREHEDWDQPMVVCGNKADLEKLREVTTAEGKEWADARNASFFETSALTGKNVQESFQQIVRNIRECRKLHPKAVKTRRAGHDFRSSCLLL